MASASAERIDATAAMGAHAPAAADRPVEDGSRKAFRAPKAAAPRLVDGAIRGIYSAEDETEPDFQSVKTFETKRACTDWYAFHRRGTNPKYPKCDHIYTTACDWNQVCELILGPLGRIRRTLPARPPPELPESNRFAANREMLVGLRSRTRLPIHEATTDESTINTLRYLFFHMRCGIFVAIRGGKVVMFVPFVNKDYVNDWAEGFTIEGGLSVEEYYRQKKTRVKERALPDVRRWWANGNIMCNVPSDKFWGDSYLTQLKHMLESCCAGREVPDVEFFINKRDFPHLKKDLSEPYDFLFSKDGVPLSREYWSTLAPIGSFFLSHEFADLPLVCTGENPRLLLGWEWVHVTGCCR
jgi:hypothetical protein